MRTLVHLEYPTQEPLTEPFHVSGWVASTDVVRAVSSKGSGWYRLADRPDVKAAHPSLPHVAGFSGPTSFSSLVSGSLVLECHVGDRIDEVAKPLEPLDLPPDDLQVRQVGGVWGRNFFAAGQEIFHQISAAFDEVGRPLATAERVLDFGCGCGRVIRMFQATPHHGEIWGCDVDADAITWSSKHLTSAAQFKLNAPFPPAPFQDGSFDAIYAMSVFTHLPEDVQLKWLIDLRRMLRPGGVLLASVHGERYWSVDPGVKDEVLQRGFAYRTGQRTPGLPDYYMVAFHSATYIYKKWAEYFDIVAHKSNYLHGVHDVVLARRPC